MFCKATLGCSLLAPMLVTTVLLCYKLEYVVSGYHVDTPNLAKSDAKVKAIWPSINIHVPLIQCHISLSMPVSSLMTTGLYVYDVSLLE